MSRILVAEDEPRVSTFIARGLRANGYVVEAVRDGVQALQRARTGGFDLMVLDLGLPRMDGLRVLTSLRQERVVIRVIVLTARDSAQDAVGALETGADDYLRKPFDFSELLARVRLRLAGDSEAAGSLLCYGDLAYDMRRHSVTVDGTSVPMSPREMALLEVLIQHPEQVLSREQLLSQVWGYDYDPGSNVLEVYVGYLRRKLGTTRIQTVRGIGYRLTQGSRDR